MPGTCFWCEKTRTTERFAEVLYLCDGCVRLLQTGAIDPRDWSTKILEAGRKAVVAAAPPTVAVPTAEQLDEYAKKLRAQMVETHARQLYYALVAATAEKARGPTEILDDKATVDRLVARAFILAEAFEDAAVLRRFPDSPFL